MCVYVLVTCVQVVEVEGGAVVEAAVAACMHVSAEGVVW